VEIMGKWVVTAQVSADKQFLILLRGGGKERSSCPCA
jgi:hypothetical protein